MAGCADKPKEATRMEDYQTRVIEERAELDLR